MGAGDRVAFGRKLSQFVAVFPAILISGCGESRLPFGHPPIGLRSSELFTVAQAFGSGSALSDALTEPSEVAFLRECKAIDVDKNFAEAVQCMSRLRPRLLAEQQKLMSQRYDLVDRAGKDKMTRGKAVQAGVRVKLPTGVTWVSLAALTPQQVKDQNLFPQGFLPLPHTNHPEGGMVFPKFQIAEVLKQTGRDLERFDLDHDFPDHLLPEFPPPVFLTTRLDLGDVSQGKLITTDNFNDLFKDVLNPKDLDGLRLLVTPLPQQQFNTTADRRSLRASLGVSCLDCHTNGHTNAAFHLVGDIRPQEFRNRIDTPSLRGLGQQRLFGSQRALMSVEDFTEFEQRAAYFDGDISLAAKKGVRTLDRPTEVHHMSEMQRLLDFPPAPKLDGSGRLIHAVATAAEVRGEKVFFGKGQCATCHAPPLYSDNQMHDLKYERFFSPREVRGNKTKPDGPVKTFPLRGIKESPPYFHDGRLLTLADTVEFFNLVLETKLNEQEKTDLVAFMMAL